MVEGLSQLDQDSWYESRCYTQALCEPLLASMGKCGTNERRVLYYSLFARFFDDGELDFGDSFRLEILGADMEFQCLSVEQMCFYSVAENALLGYLMDRGFVKNESDFLQSAYKVAFKLFICREVEELLDVDWGGGQLKKILLTNAEVAENIRRIGS